MFRMPISPSFPPCSGARVAAGREMGLSDRPLIIIGEGHNHRINWDVRVNLGEPE